MAIRCPKCGVTFNDDTSYQSHLPCGSVYGGSGDLRSGSQETVRKGGDGSN